MVSEDTTILRHKYIGCFVYCRVQTNAHYLPVVAFRYKLKTRVEDLHLYNKVYGSNGVTVKMPATATPPPSIYRRLGLQFT
jgi:hypothetical protein